MAAAPRTSVLMFALLALAATTAWAVVEVQCEDGYRADANGLCCDINECEEGTFWCPDNSVCENGDGCYNCICNDGYRMFEDECCDINECEEGNFWCPDNSVCENADGCYNCICNDGYRMFEDECCDINECEEGNFWCPDNSVCENADGCYNCICNDGYTMFEDECCDINECETGAFECGTNEECCNNDGGYTCECIEGFVNNGNGCEEVAEPLPPADPCADVTCTEPAVATPAGDSCECMCQSGFEYRGVFGCRDIDECMLSAPCLLDNEECVNTEGGYDCVCMDGYMRGEGGACVRDCDADPLSCLGDDAVKTAMGDECVCECPQGFEYRDALGCRDIDECDTGAVVCPAEANKECVNNEGGASCECVEGYSEVEGGDCVRDCEAERLDCHGDQSLVSKVLNGETDECECVCEPGYDYRVIYGCRNVNECNTYDEICGPNEKCVDMTPGYECVCEDGFRHDGKMCVADPCADNPCRFLPMSECEKDDEEERGYNCVCPYRQVENELFPGTCRDEEPCRDYGGDEVCSRTGHDCEDASSTEYECVCPRGTHVLDHESRGDDDDDGVLLPRCVCDEGTHPEVRDRGIGPGDLIVPTCVRDDDDSRSGVSSNADVMATNSVTVVAASVGVAAAAAGIAATMYVRRSRAAAAAAAEASV